MGLGQVLEREFGIYVGRGTRARLRDVGRLRHRNLAMLSISKNRYTCNVTGQSLKVARGRVGTLARALDRPWGVYGAGFYLEREFGVYVCGARHACEIEGRGHYGNYTCNVTGLSLKVEKGGGEGLAFCLRVVYRRGFLGAN